MIGPRFLDEAKVGRIIQIITLLSNFSISRCIAENSEGVAISSSHLIVKGTGSDYKELALILQLLL